MTPLQDTRSNASPFSLLSFAEPLLLSVLLVYLAYEFLLSHVEGDQAYLLYAAQQMFHGVSLDGPRLIETNPPLIVWFNLLPAWLSHVLHTGPVLALRIVTLATLATGAGWTAWIIKRSRLAGFFVGRDLRLLWAMSALLIVVTRPAEFGQREQLLLAFFLPYLFAAGTGVMDKLGVQERVALGCAAGLGICFKPHHILTLAALEIFLAVYRRLWSRLWSPELLAAAAIGLLYVAAVRVFTPPYLSTIMPLLQNTYWALGQYTFAAMALHVGMSFSLFAVIATLTWLAAKKRLACSMLTGALLAAAIGAALAYFVQRTGWYHQSFPAVALFETSAVWLIADAVRSFRPQLLRYGALSKTGYAMVVLTGLLLCGAAMRMGRHTVQDTNSLTAELEQCPQGSTVYAFSIGMNSFPVVLDRHLQWGSRFAHLWMLPAILQNEASESTSVKPFHVLPKPRVEALADLQRRELTEDLTRTQPRFVFVERCSAEQPCNAFPASFDAVGWFSRDPDFARLWSGYRLQKRLDLYDEYVKSADLAASPAGL